MSGQDDARGFEEREDAEAIKDPEDATAPGEDAPEGGDGRKSAEPDDGGRLAWLAGAAEALLFVSDEPVSTDKLASMLEVSPKEADRLLGGLADDYERGGRGVQLRQVAGGWRLYTHPAYHELIERYVLSWDPHKLSQAALEALSVIAYSQPVTRQGVAAVRGVNSDGVIASLVEKGLVREVGRDASPGTPILYGTTSVFLEKFGLASIDELPPLEDFAPDEQTRQLISQRLAAARPASAADGGADGQGFDDSGDGGDVDEVLRGEGA